MHRNDRRAVQRGVAAVFTTGRLRKPHQLALYQATARVLGELGREGARSLQRTYDNNRRFPKKPEWVPFRAILLENIGKTKEESMVKFLMDEARRSPEKALEAAAGAALGSYSESNQKIRKDIVKNLLIRWGELDARWRNGNTDPFDIASQDAGEYLAAIKDKWNSTLVQMTGQNIGTYFDWQQWWNSDKNANWDKG